MALPNEPHGFAVNVFTREIHKRHARHALDLRRTTPGGLSGVLHGKDPVLCKDCFPPPPKPERPSRTSQRFTPEPVKVEEPVKEPKSSRSLSTADLSPEKPEAEDDGSPDEG